MRTLAWAKGHSTRFTTFHNGTPMFTALDRRLLASATLPHKPFQRKSCLHQHNIAHHFHFLLIDLGPLQRFEQFGLLHPERQALGKQRHRWSVGCPGSSRQRCRGCPVTPQSTLHRQPAHRPAQDAERTRYQAQESRISGDAELLKDFASLHKALGLGWTL